VPIPVLDGGIIFFIFFIFIFAVAVAVVATLSSRSVFFGSFFFLDDGFGKALLDFLLRAGYLKVSVPKFLFYSVTIQRQDFVDRDHEQMKRIKEPVIKPRNNPRDHELK